MSPEENKVLARRVIEEVINGRNLDLLDTLVSDDYVERTPLPPGLPANRDGLRAVIQTIFDGFSDFHYTIEDELAEGDYTAQRLTAYGTHTGKFAGVPPSGKKVSWSEMHEGRNANGKFVEHWAVADQLGLLQQLGVLPAPDAVTA